MKTRKGFNFYRSYYEVAMELSLEDRALFLTALMEKQFEDKEPSLEGISKLAYLSQKHSINSQVEGFKSKKGIDPSEPPREGGNEPPTEPPTEPPSYVSGDSVMTTEPPSQPPTEPPSVQEQEQGKEKEKVKEQDLEKDLEEKNTSIGKNNLTPEEELDRLMGKLGIFNETKKIK